MFIMLILASASACLWWLLSRAQQLNTQQQAEIAKLRGQLRALRV